MLGLDENGLLECVFEFLTNLFTELTVHACNLFIHLKLITNGVKITIHTAKPNVGCSMLFCEVYKLDNAITTQSLGELWGIL